MPGTSSIIDAPTAALYMASGANFIVGPSFNPEVAKLCNRRKVLYIPGTATATEIATAEEYGAEICKVFPGDTLGSGFIKAVLAPCPWHRLLPTGGVDATAASIGEWIKAGAAAIEGIRAEATLDEVIAANPKQLEQYRAGKKTGETTYVSGDNASLDLVASLTHTHFTLGDGDGWSTSPMGASLGIGMRGTPALYRSVNVLLRATAPTLEKTSRPLIRSFSMSIG